MLDNSPAVRDATIELVGKYIVSSPELAADYYEKVADRIAVRLYCYEILLESE